MLQFLTCMVCQFPLYILMTRGIFCKNWFMFIVCVCVCVCVCVHSHLQNEHNGLFHKASQMYDKIKRTENCWLSSSVSEVTRDLILFSCDFFYPDWLWYIAFFLMGTGLSRRWSNCSFGVDCAPLYSIVCLRLGMGALTFTSHHMGRLQMKSLYLWWKSLSLNYQILWLFSWLQMELEDSLSTSVNNFCHTVCNATVTVAYLFIIWKAYIRMTAEEESIRYASYRRSV